MPMRVCKLYKGPSLSAKVGWPQTGLLPAPSHTASSASLSSKVTRLYRIRADLEHRWPCTCKERGEVAEPVPAPRTVTFSEAGARECCFFHC